jgi:hypothetical protein
MVQENFSHEPEPEETLEGRVCAGCGHDERAHVVQDAELPGGTMRRTCETCDAFHEFVPDPRSL